MSQRPTPKHDPNMNYQNFKDTCPRYLTYLTDKDYRDTSKRLSPWAVMEGWRLLSCFHDAMHTIFLGIGRDIVSNILADMLDCGVLGPGTLDEQLRRLSLEMHRCFKKEKSFGLRLVAFFEIQHSNGRLNNLIRNRNIIGIRVLGDERPGYRSCKCLRCFLLLFMVDFYCMDSTH